MTNFSKIEGYYSVFDEWRRLDAPSGKLELEMMKEIITNQLTKGDVVLDLGGGPGR